MKMKSGFKLHYLDYLADGRKDETDINERKKEFSLEYDQLIKRQEIEKKNI